MIRLLQLVTWLVAAWLSIYLEKTMAPDDDAGPGWFYKPNWRCTEAWSQVLMAF